MEILQENTSECDVLTLCFFLYLLEVFSWIFEVFKLGANHTWWISFKICHRTFLFLSNFYVFCFVFSIATVYCCPCCEETDHQGVVLILLMLDTACGPCLRSLSVNHSLKDYLFLILTLISLIVFIWSYLIPQLSEAVHNFAYSKTGCLHGHGMYT